MGEMSVSTPQLHRGIAVTTGITTLIDLGTIAEMIDRTTRAAMSDLTTITAETVIEIETETAIIAARRHRRRHILGIQETIATVTQAIVDSA